MRVASIYHTSPLGYYAVNNEGIYWHGREWFDFPFYFTGKYDLIRELRSRNYEIKDFVPAHPPRHSLIILDETNRVLVTIQIDSHRTVLLPDEMEFIIQAYQKQYGVTGPLHGIYVPEVHLNGADL